jgi:predicted nucleic acid-binding protein
VILIDRDVLIEHLRGNAAARDWLVRARQSSGPLAISVVTLTEGTELATMNVRHYPMFPGLARPFLTRCAARQDVGSCVGLMP